MGPMDQIGMPQQLLAHGVGGLGGGAGPTIPAQMMVPPGMGGGMDPRIMAYIRALTGGGAAGGAPQIPGQPIVA